MKIKFFLDTSITRKEGHPLKLYIYVNSKDRKYPTTKFFSHAKDWDFEKEEPKKTHPLYLAIKDFLFEHNRKILQLLNSRNKKSSDQIERYILGNSDSIYDFWKIRIEEFKKLHTKKSNADLKKIGNAEKYENNLSVFMNYKPELYYEDIDYNFLNSFKLHKSETCNAGGINTYIANLRAVYYEAVKRGYYTPNNPVSPFKGIMEKKEATKDKDLTFGEMKVLFKNPIDHNFYRYFMLCFYLGGLDFIDIASIKKEHIRNNRIKFTRFKGGTNEVIDNYIFEEAKKIIDYFDDPETEYITPIHKYEYKPYRDKYVREIRKKFKPLGVESYVDSKTPRYTFINIGAKELFLNRDIIKEIIGHAQNDTLSIYEGKFPYHIKDKIHQEIIDSIKA